jgi:ankyrin repeat protein
LVNFKDHAKETALHIACRNGHAGVVESLIKHKANINEQNAQGCTPFQLAVAGGHQPVVEVLCSSSFLTISA